MFSRESPIASCSQVGISVGGRSTPRVSVCERECVCMVGLAGCYIVSSSSFSNTSPRRTVAGRSWGAEQYAVDRILIELPGRAAQVGPVIPKNESSRQLRLPGEADGYEAGRWMV